MPLQSRIVASLAVLIEVDPQTTPLDTLFRKTTGHEYIDMIHSRTGKVIRRIQERDQIRTPWWMETILSCLVVSEIADLLLYRGMEPAILLVD